MFTGIIEEIGAIRNIERNGGKAMIITVAAKRILEDIKLGDSIAINGVCLTVVRFDSSTFSVDVMPETFRQTNLRELATGGHVNLERAMPANGRFGGHIVQGHVDGIGVIVKRMSEENAVVFSIAVEDRDIGNTVIPHGSITIDGISLTVVRAAAEQFTVSIIPHTLRETVLQEKGVGATVNIETDILGKYVSHLLSGRAQDHRNASGITVSMLAENGYL